MKIISKGLSLLWRCWFVLLAFICTLSLGLVMIPFCFREKDYPKAYFLMRVWATIVLYGSGVTIEKRNFKDLNQHHPFIIIANHTSMMDVMVMLIVNKKPMVFVGKKELEKLPVFGFIFKRTHILVDRKNDQSRKAVYRKSFKKIKEGKSICLFPEAGVPDRSVFLDEFKDGPFSMSVFCKVPLVTTTLCGLKQILPYAYFKGHPGKVTLILNSILETTKLSKQDIPLLKEKSRNEILSTLENCAQNHQHY